MYSRANFQCQQGRKRVISYITTGTTINATESSSTQLQFCPMLQCYDPPTFTYWSVNTSLDFLSFKSYFPRVSIEKARVMTRHQRHDGICGSCNKMLAWKISIGVRISKGEMSRADFYQYRSTKVSSLAASSQRNVFITQTKLCLQLWTNLMILIIENFNRVT